MTIIVDKKAPQQQAGADDISVLQPLSSADHEITSPKVIVNNQLIARALQYGELETAAAMANKMAQPGPPVKDMDIALKDGMIAFIKIFPAIKQEIELARDNALAVQNRVKDKYKNIRALK